MCFVVAVASFLLQAEEHPLPNKIGSPPAKRPAGDTVYLRQGEGRAGE